MRQVIAGTLALAAAAALRAADPPSLKAELGREVIGPRQTLVEAQDYLEAKVPRMPKLTAAADWEQEAERLRKEVLDKVVFRGAARDWRDAKLKVEWLDTIPGG